MKKLITLILLCSFIFAAFADDAKVMPAGVIRGTFAFTSTTADEEYDVEGEAQDIDALSIMDLGTALELGVTNQVTAAVQWAPGYRFSGEIEDSEADLSGLNDLFIGAKIQVMGEQGFVANDMMRFAFAPGLLVPLENTDIDESAENYLAGDSFKPGVFNQAFGYGGRVYFDYNVMPGFFVNVYSEYIGYLPVEKKSLTDEASYLGTYAGTVAAMQEAPYNLTEAQAIAYADENVTEAEEKEYKYGYKLTFEVEPQYTYSLGDVGSISAGLPVTYTMTPEYEVEGETVDDSNTSLLQVKPWISFFTTKTGAPMSFKVAYYVPVMGEGTNATSTLLLQARIYAKLF